MPRKQPRQSVRVSSRRDEQSDALGDLLCDARLTQRPRMSQEAVADELGVAQSTVSTWESGRVRPDLQTLGQLADLLGLDLIELVEAAVGKPLNGIKADQLVQAAQVGLDLNRLTDAADRGVDLAKLVKVAAVVV